MAIFSPGVCIRVSALIISRHMRKTAATGKAPSWVASRWRMTWASRPGRERQSAGRLGARDPADHVGAPADQAVQVAVDGVDFLPQTVESGCVHKAGNSCAQRRYYVQPPRVKANKPQGACTGAARSV